MVNYIWRSGIASYLVATCCDKISLTDKTPLLILNLRKSIILICISSDQM